MASVKTRCSSRSSLVIAFLKATGISYTDYNTGASLYQLFLTPSTVCLAIPLYKQLELLKKNLTAVAAAITAGVIGSVVSVYVMSMIFRLEHVHYVSLLPKSITTAIGMGIIGGSRRDRDDDDRQHHPDGNPR